MSFVPVFQPKHDRSQTKRQEGTQTVCEVAARRSRSRLLWRFAAAAGCGAEKSSKVERKRGRGRGGAGRWGRRRVGGGGDTWPGLAPGTQQKPGTFQGVTRTGNARTYRARLREGTLWSCEGHHAHLGWLAGVGPPPPGGGEGGENVRSRQPGRVCLPTPPESEPPVPVSFSPYPSVIRRKRSASHKTKQRGSAIGGGGLLSMPGRAAIAGRGWKGARLLGRPRQRQWLSIFGDGKQVELAFNPTRTGHTALRPFILKQAKRPGPFSLSRALGCLSGTPPPHLPVPLCLCTFVSGDRSRRYGCQ
ncbi:hypothetical protein F5148DRAFT_1365314 [Russula earlei]|uniref:Uncharacterized protein n=1 Tax=Russula earlei TaxID=71964 RepID=A0ACC0UL23_9AGAM|nr:hypothetical protein F5148DRAFT_1365314 [Russula earlei]